MALAYPQVADVAKARSKHTWYTNRTSAFTAEDRYLREAAAREALTKHMWLMPATKNASIAAEAYLLEAVVQEALAGDTSWVVASCKYLSLGQKN